MNHIRHRDGLVAVISEPNPILYEGTVYDLEGVPLVTAEAQLEPTVGWAATFTTVAPNRGASGPEWQTSVRELPAIGTFDALLDTAFERAAAVAPAEAIPWAVSLELVVDAVDPEEAIGKFRLAVKSGGPWDVVVTPALFDPIVFHVEHDGTVTLALDPDMLGVDES